MKLSHSVSPFEVFQEVFVLLRAAGSNLGGGGDRPALDESPGERRGHLSGADEPDAYRRRRRRGRRSHDVQMSIVNLSN